MTIKQVVQQREGTWEIQMTVAAWENPCPLPRSSSDGRSGFDLGCPLQMVPQTTLLLVGRSWAQAVPSLDEMEVASGQEKLYFSEQLRKLGKQSAVCPPPYLPLSR